MALSPLPSSVSAPATPGNSSLCPVGSLSAQLFPDWFLVSLQATIYVTFLGWPALPALAEAPTVPLQAPFTPSSSAASHCWSPSDWFTVAPASQTEPLQMGTLFAVLLLYPWHLRQCLAEEALCSYVWTVQRLPSSA